METATATRVTSSIDFRHGALACERRLADCDLPARERDKYQALIAGLKNGAPLESALLLDVFRILQAELFPHLGTGFKHEDGDYLDFEKFGGRYIYFAPSHALISGLLDEALLLQMFQHPEWHVLSVGAGSACLERLLLRIGAIAPGKLVVADAHAQDLPPDLHPMVFDMNQPWPVFAKKFDLILFSESLCGITPVATLPSSEAFFYPSCSRDAAAAQLANRTYEGIINVIDQALTNLAKGGQLRMTDKPGIQHHSKKLAQRLRLKGHRPVTIQPNTPDGLLVIHH